MSGASPDYSVRKIAQLRHYLGAQSPSMPSASNSTRRAARRDGDDKTIHQPDNNPKLSPTKTTTPSEGTLVDAKPPAKDTSEYYHDLKSKSRNRMNPDEVETEVTARLHAFGREKTRRESLVYSTRPLDTLAVRRRHRGQRPDFSWSNGGVLPTELEDDVPSTRKEDIVPAMLRQPITRPISHDQLVIEVKSIYAGLVILEAKAIEVDEIQLQQPLPRLQKRSTGNISHSTKSCEDLLRKEHAAVRSFSLSTGANSVAESCKDACSTRTASDLMSESSDGFEAPPPSQHPVRQDTRLQISKLTPDKYQSLIALHKQLLHEHHDFFLASQHPAASQNLSGLASKYAMAGHMRKHRVHQYLRPPRVIPPDSIKHVLPFTGAAYSLLPLPYETVPIFEDTWIEYQDKLCRLRVAIDYPPGHDREDWVAIARCWYVEALIRSQWSGQLLRDLASLPGSCEAIQYYVFPEVLTIKQMQMIERRLTQPTVYLPTLNVDRYRDDLQSLYGLRKRRSMPRRFGNGAHVSCSHGLATTLSLHFKDPGKYIEEPFRPPEVEHNLVFYILLAVIGAIQSGRLTAVRSGNVAIQRGLDVLHLNSFTERLYIAAKRWRSWQGNATRSLGPHLTPGNPPKSQKWMRKIGRAFAFDCRWGCAALAMLPIASARPTDHQMASGPSDLADFGWRSLIYIPPAVGILIAAIYTSPRVGPRRTYECLTLVSGILVPIVAQDDIDNPALTLTLVVTWCLFAANYTHQAFKEIGFPSRVGVLIFVTGIALDLSFMSTFSSNGSATASKDFGLLFPASYSTALAITSHGTEWLSKMYNRHWTRFLGALLPSTHQVQTTQSLRGSG